MPLRAELRPFGERLVRGPHRLARLLGAGGVADDRLRVGWLKHGNLVRHLAALSRDEQPGMGVLGARRDLHRLSLVIVPSEIRPGVQYV
jgi:transposase InsO family protein